MTKEERATSSYVTSIRPGAGTRKGPLLLSAYSTVSTQFDNLAGVKLSLAYLVLPVTRGDVTKRTQATACGVLHLIYPHDFRGRTDRLLSQSG